MVAHSIAVAASVKRLTLLLNNFTFDEIVVRLDSRYNRACLLNIVSAFAAANCFGGERPFRHAACPLFASTAREC